LTAAPETTAFLLTRGALMLLRLGRVLLFATYAILAASLLLFSVFECFPSLLDSVNLQSIAYYALKHELIADPSLEPIPIGQLVYT
jgi:hypothetical protein